MQNQIPKLKVYYQIKAKDVNKIKKIPHTLF